MTNNQLTDKRSQLRKAAQNYRIALAWYQSNIDSPAALQSWDAATAEFMAAIGNRETDIIADLFDEIAELQEHRHAETADREMLKQLARIMSGSDTPGEIRSLTVTAQSLIERCKALASRHPVVAYTDAVELAVVRQGGDGVIWGNPRAGGGDIPLCADQD